MSLLITMLPVYVLGNLHCIGMCGPLVMMIGRHRYRYWYFLGRTLSFTLVGMIAGEAGAVLHFVLSQYHVPAITSFLFGGFILVLGGCQLTGRGYPGQAWLAQHLTKINQSLSILMLKDRAWPTFLFGFLTVFLPCGQTLLVFSACALSGNLFVGFVNGLAFALLTSPSLFLAMHAHTFFHRVKRYDQQLIGGCAILVGVLAICRGLAEAGLISHWIVNSQYHIVIY